MLEQKLKYWIANVKIKVILLCDLAVSVVELTQLDCIQVGKNWIKYSAYIM